MAQRADQLGYFPPRPNFKLVPPLADRPEPVDLPRNVVVGSLKELTGGPLLGWLGRNVRRQHDYFGDDPAQGRQSTITGHLTVGCVVSETQSPRTGIFWPKVKSFKINEEQRHGLPEGVIAVIGAVASAQETLLEYSCTVSPDRPLPSTESWLG